LEEMCCGRSKASGGREGSMPVYGRRAWIAVARLTVKNMIEDTPADGEWSVWAEQKETLAVEDEQRWRPVHKRDMKTQSHEVEPFLPVHLKVHLNDKDTGSLPGSQSRILSRAPGRIGVAKRLLDRKRKIRFL
jgi:hypothetical protein